jgi:hypothetical protein
MRLEISPRILAVAVVTALICSCGFSEDKTEAMGLADRYFVAAADSDIEATLPFYSSRFFEATPRDDWTRTLGGVRSRCGIPKSHTLNTWNASSRIGTNGGSTVTLIYDVEYAHCRISETISTFRPDGGERQIIGHYFKLEDASLRRVEKTATIT